ncbi:hypothetical protein ACFLZZ_01125 [Nanoarchaeota archaeon]
MGIFERIIDKIFGYSFTPKIGVWYRNKIIEKDIGHYNTWIDCKIIINGKEKEGSFKVIGNKVRYLLGNRYDEKKVKTIPIERCKFYKEEMDRELVNYGHSSVKSIYYWMEIK